MANVPTPEHLHDELAKGVEGLLEAGVNRQEMERVLVELATDVRHHRPLRKYTLEAVTRDED